MAFASRYPARLGALIALISSPAFAGEIFTFVDEQGVAHYSNLSYADRRYVPLSPQRIKDTPGRASRASDEHAARFAALIEQAALSNALDPQLLHAIIRVESGYNPKARSSKGAQGLMQLMPETGRRYRVRDPYDPQENIEGGSRYLKDLLARFDNNLELALAGYHAGEGAVLLAGKRIPRYPETLAYVPRVLGLYRARLRPPAN
jgi:soluble lytic murein transglycosylase-like protein